MIKFLLISLYERLRAFDDAVFAWSNGKGRQFNIYTHTKLSIVHLCV